MYKLNKITFDKNNLPFNLKELELDFLSLNIEYVFPKVDKNKYFPGLIRRLDSTKFELIHLQIISAISYWEKKDSFEAFKQYLKNGFYKENIRYNSYICNNDPCINPDILINQPFANPSGIKESEGDLFFLNIRYAIDNKIKGTIEINNEKIHHLIGAEKQDIDGIIILSNKLNRDEKQKRIKYYNDTLHYATRIFFGNM